MTTKPLFLVAQLPAVMMGAVVLLALGSMLVIQLLKALRSRMDSSDNA